MDTDMRQRLREVLDADPRSDNKISEDASLGRNYVRSILKEGKTPRTEKLFALLKELGEGATVYVLTGRRITEADLEFLNLASGMSPSAKANAIELFRDLLGREEV